MALLTISILSHTQSFSLKRERAFHLIEYRSFEIGICQFCLWTDQLLKYFSIFGIVCAFNQRQNQRLLQSIHRAKGVFVRALIKAENHAVNFDTLKTRLTFFFLSICICKHRIIFSLVLCVCVHVCEQWMKQEHTQFVYEMESNFNWSKMSK